MDKQLKDYGDISAPNRTKEIVSRHGFSFKKSLGQNFLVDQNILRKIVEAAELGPDDGALEIGPGIGSLTEPLAREAKAVLAVEIDQRLIPILDETLASYSNVQIVHGDVLKLPLGDLLRQHLGECEQVSVVANLPYYVTTPIVMKLLEEKLPLRNIVVMIQKEVADRMASGPGTKDYGSLSIAVSYYCEPQLVTIVPRTVFIPQPNVDSAVIKLKVRDRPPVQVEDEAFFFEVVQAAFAQRRKTVANNLLARFFGKGERSRLETILAEAGIDPVRRGETLSIDEYARLSNTMLRSL